ncbi:unnamed protein product [Miscanthus lutarioriparius]|uniref:Transposase-associated domain-containing protein n=1 Tax=Miscanthus lutarioriparius TaxID=422564 RepID=A0A811RIP3_9POAL|nr:unnamed protein product [Miscanthus lutarioriparius]
MPPGTLKMRSDRAAAVRATPHEINATGSFAAFWLASDISSVNLTAGMAISLCDSVRVDCDAGNPGLLISAPEGVEVEMEMEGKIDLAADLYMPGTRLLYVWLDTLGRHLTVLLAAALLVCIVGSKILCPCRKCVNSFWKEASEVREHLICDGFLKGYRTWNLHGEASSSVNHGNCDAAEVIEDSSEDDEIFDLLRDLDAGLDDRGDFEDNSSTLETCPELVALQKLVAENSKELYPNCKKYTQLRFLIRLLRIKLLGGWSDRSMNLLLDLLNDALPEGSNLPRNFHEAKKLVKSIGVGYNSIHACPNDCVLYWKENVDLNECPKCEVSRWKSDRKSLDGRHVYKVPKKSPRSTENVDAHHHDAHFEEDEDYGDNEDHDACPEEGEYLFARRCLAAHTKQFHQHSPTSAAHTVQTHATSPHQCAPNDTAHVAQHHAPLSSHRFPNNAAPTVQHGAAHEEQPHATSFRQCIPSNVLPAVQHDATHEVQPDAAKRAKPVQPQVGMNVMLYEVVRSNARVALGTIISTNPKTIIGGVPLGKQYCEVVVNHVLKRDATLPRTYPGV